MLDHVVFNWKDTKKTQQEELKLIFKLVKRKFGSKLASSQIFSHLSTKHPFYHVNSLIGCSVTKPNSSFHIKAHYDNKHTLSPKHVVWLFIEYRLTWIPCSSIMPIFIEHCNNIHAHASTWGVNFLSNYMYFVKWNFTLRFCFLLPSNSTLTYIHKKKTKVKTQD